MRIQENIKNKFLIVKLNLIRGSNKCYKKMDLHLIKKMYLNVTNLILFSTNKQLHNKI